MTGRGDDTPVLVPRQTLSEADVSFKRYHTPAVCPDCGSRFKDGRKHCSFDGAKLVQEGRDPLIGTRVENYQVLEAIGEGGMGCVYRVRHVMLGREYALKMLVGEFAANQTVRTRFLREARAAATIEHENVVRVVYSGENERGQAFLVMELIEGRPLSHFIADGVPGSDRVANIARQIALGLQHIHAAGFVHRDIKPSNVMLIGPPGQERVKILDLGLVGILGPSNEADPRITQSEHVLGTPHYMAPEPMLGEEYTASADLYALGAVIYEMISGHPPFRGSTAEVLKKHLSARPEPLPWTNGMDELAMELLEKDPRQRPGSAAAVVARIEELQRHGVVARKASVVAKRARRGLVRNQRVVAFLGALVVAGVVIGVANRVLMKSEGAPAVEVPALSPAPEVEKPKPAELEPMPEPLPEPPLPITPPSPVAVPDERKENRKTKKAKRAAAPPESAEPAEPIEVTVTSDPPGAAVLMQGGQLGITPLTIALAPNRPVPLVLRLPGFPDRKATLRPTPKTRTLHIQMETGATQ